MAGDDRAEEILAVGDRPLNVDRMPANMKAWLKTYAEQIDYLFDNPD
ncbi:Spi family protease inhibitor, partial [Selenomonas sp.]